MPTTISDWVWWIFSVILVGILASLGGNYVQRWIDAYRGKHSEEQRLKNEARNKQMQEEVEILLANPQEREFFYFSLIQDNVTTTSMIVLQLLLFAGFYFISQTPLPVSSTTGQVSLSISFVFKWFTAIVLIVTLFLINPKVSKEIGEYRYKVDVSKLLREKFNERFEGNYKPAKATKKSSKRQGNESGG